MKLSWKLKTNLRLTLNSQLNSTLLCLSVFCCAAIFEAPEAKAWPGKKKAVDIESPERAEAPEKPPASEPTPQAAVNKAKVPDLLQTDRSTNLTYVLPEGWLATQNPFYGHDLLMKKSTPKRSLVIADRDAKGGLSKVCKELEAELAKQCQDFKLVSNETTQLSSGVSCVRLVSTGKVEDVEICQVNYLMPYIHGRLLHLTGTLNKGDQPGIETCDQFASSIKVKKAKGLL